MEILVPSTLWLQYVHSLFLGGVGGGGGGGGGVGESLVIHHFTSYKSFYYNSSVRDV